MQLPFIVELVRFLFQIYSDLQTHQGRQDAFYIDKAAQREIKKTRYRGQGLKTTTIGHCKYENIGFCQNLTFFSILKDYVKNMQCNTGIAPSTQEQCVELFLPCKLLCKHNSLVWMDMRLPPVRIFWRGVSVRAKCSLHTNNTMPLPGSPQKLLIFF